MLAVVGTVVARAVFLDRRGFSFWVQVLNLHSNGIRRIEGLSDLHSLEALILSFNFIDVLEGVSTLTRLTFLDVSFNRIQSIGVRCTTSPLFVKLT